jgi:hypothetical protein
MADTLLELEEMSIPAFVQVLAATLGEDDDEDDDYDARVDEFTHVALTGQHPEHDTQIVLNGQGNVLSATQSDLVDQLRDYDSLLGATMTLPYQEELHVYLVSPFQEALKAKVHIRMRLPTHVSQSPPFIALW